MQDFSRKYKNILGVGIFVAIILPLIYFGWHFLLVSIETKADRIQEKLIDNELTKQKIQNIPQMAKTDAEFEKNKDATETIFDAGASVGLIEYLEKLADSTGNAITIQILEKKKEVKAKTVPNLSDEEATAIKESAPPKSLEEKLAYKNYMYLQINLTGDYATFLNFMHKLENNAQYVNIISFTAQKELEDSAKTTQSLKVGDVFQIASDPGALAPAPKKAVLKSSLIVVVYTE